MYNATTLQRIEFSILSLFPFSKKKIQTGKVLNKNECKILLITSPSVRGQAYKYQNIIEGSFISKLVSITKLNDNILSLDVRKLYKKIELENEGNDSIFQETIKKENTLVERNEKSIEIKKNEVFFTEEEEKVFKLLCRWFSKLDIAYELGLMDTEFSKIKKSIFEKVGVKSKSGLVIYAYEHGLYEGDETTENRIYFSDIENAIITGICKGTSLTMISTQVSVELTTVKNYHYEILKRIEGKSNADLIVYALKHKIYVTQT